MKRFRRGLVVGKFAPLHRGHELVIRAAEARCDQLILLSYSHPELPGCPPERRARWLEALFPTALRCVLTDQELRAQGWPGLPHNDAPDHEHRQLVARVCLERLGGPVDAVFTSEDYGEGFAQRLTALFREADPSAAVEHVLVDRDRQALPISGTRIRADVHAHRQWLSPVVYASFVERVCLLGGESSGKTTLAAALAAAHDTVWVPEYGRHLWEEKAGALAFGDLRAIAERQVADEEAAALRAHRWVFCDSSPLTTLFYSRALFDRADPALEALAERAYDRVVLCAPDFPFVQDGTRRDATFRDRQHAWYLEALAGAEIPYLLVTGSLDTRLAQVRAWL